MRFGFLPKEKDFPVVVEGDSEIFSGHAGMSMRDPYKERDYFLKIQHRASSGLGLRINEKSFIWLCEESDKWVLIVQALPSAREISAEEVSEDQKLSDFVFEVDRFRYDVRQKVFSKTEYYEVYNEETDEYEEKARTIREARPVVSLDGELILDNFSYITDVIQMKEYLSVPNLHANGKTYLTQKGYKWVVKTSKYWEPVVNAVGEAADLRGEITWKIAEEERLAEEAVLSANREAALLKKALAKGVFKTAGFYESEYQLKAAYWAGKVHRVEQAYGKIGPGPYTMRIEENKPWVLETVQGATPTYRIVAFKDELQSKVSGLTSFDIKFLNNGLKVFAGHTATKLDSGIVVIGIWPIDEVPMIRFSSSRGYSKATRGFTEIKCDPATEKFEKKFFSEAEGAALGF